MANEWWRPTKATATFTTSDVFSNTYLRSIPTYIHVPSPKKARAPEWRTPDVPTDRMAVRSESDSLPWSRCAQLGCSGSFPRRPFSLTKWLKKKERGKRKKKNKRELTFTVSLSFDLACMHASTYARTDKHNFRKLFRQFEKMRLGGYTHIGT